MFGTGPTACGDVRLGPDVLRLLFEAAKLHDLERDGGVLDRGPGEDDAVRRRTCEPVPGRGDDFFGGVRGLAGRVVVGGVTIHASIAGPNLVIPLVVLQ